MKTTKILISALFVLFFSLSSCESAQILDTEIVNEDLDVNDDQMQILVFTTDSNDISSSEIEGLLLMREEEKMAGDIYSLLYEKFNLRVFANITKSENQHTNAVLTLITHFNLNDPALESEGEFNDEIIQKIYDDLIAQSTTIDEALKTGAFIEEYDIADLNKLIAETQNADIITVYQNLLRGSKNHIKAFTRILESRGIIYSPTILSTEEYNNIIQ